MTEKTEEQVIKSVFCAITGAFLEASYRQDNPNKDFTLHGSAFTTAFLRECVIKVHKKSRMFAFLRPDMTFLAEALLKAGFSVVPTPDEEYALGLAAVQDFHLHKTTEMYLATGKMEGSQLEKMLAPCHITWLQSSPQNIGQKVLPAPTQKRIPENLPERKPERKPEKVSTTVPKVREEIPTVRQQEPQPESKPISVQIPEETLTQSNYPVKSFPCAELKDNLRQRLQEVRVRRKSMRGNQLNPCSPIPLIDTVSGRDCELLEQVLNTAYQAFRWIHEFQGKLTPEHTELLREYATLGASSLCILRTWNKSRYQRDYPDSRLWELATSTLQAVKEVVSENIPYARLEGCIAVSIIPRNCATLRKLEQRKSATRLQNRLRELLREISLASEQGDENPDCENPTLFSMMEQEKTPVKRREKTEIWAEIVAIVTDLGEKFDEPCDSDFLIDLFQPYWDEMPNFKEENDADDAADDADDDGVIPVTPFFWRMIVALEELNAEQEETLEEIFDDIGTQSPESVENLSLETDFAERLSSNDMELLMRVRHAFQGTQMVFIGGTPKPKIRERIERYFGVKLIWVECKHHYGFDRFRAWIHNPEVSCFLVKKVWCAHAHSQELVHEILQAGKKCVRLGKENHPIPIALKIVEQCLQN